MLLLFLVQCDFCLHLLRPQSELLAADKLLVLRRLSLLVHALAELNEILEQLLRLVGRLGEVLVRVYRLL